MVTIRHLGVNKEYSTISDAVRELSKLKLQHITLLWRSKKTGFQRLAFVSVDARGDVYNSNGVESLFDFSVIANEI